MGPNSDILFALGGQSRFYGNWPETGCLDYDDTYQSNLFELHNVSQVKFVDPIGLDFHLQESSPAKDAGVTLANGPPIGIDYDEIVRADPKDQGAFEYVATTTTTTVPTTGLSTVTTCDMKVELHVVDQTRSTCNGNKVSCKVAITNSNFGTYLHDIEARVAQVTQEYSAKDASQHFDSAPAGLVMASGSTHNGCLTHPEADTNMMNVVIVCGTFRLNDQYVCASSEDLASEEAPTLEFMTLARGGGSSSSSNSSTRPAKSKRAKGSGGFFKRLLQEEESNEDLTVTFPQTYIWDETSGEEYFPMILSSVTVWEVDACLLLPPGHVLAAVLDADSAEPVPLEGECSHVMVPGEGVVLLFQTAEEIPWGTRALRNKKHPHEAGGGDIKGRIEATEKGGKK